MMPRITVLTAIFLFFINISFAQKKPLDHDVYDFWKSVREQQLTNDGQYAVYVLRPQDGDAELKVYDTKAGEKTSIVRAEELKTTYDSKFLIFKIKPQKDTIWQAKLKKVKKEDMPKDSLGIYSFSGDSLVKIPNVKSYKIPAEGTGWMAYQLEKVKPAKKDTTNAEEENEKKDHVKDADEKTDKKKTKESTSLIIRNLNIRKEYSYPKVTDYIFSKNGNVVAFASENDDSTFVPGVYLFNTKEQSLKRISSGEGSYKQLAADIRGEQIAFAANKDTGDVKIKIHKLYYHKGKRDSAYVIVDTANPALPHKWMVSENGNIYFSENGERLFFGTAPIPPEALDDSIPQDEKAMLDVWSWKDPYIQPMQLSRLEDEKKRSFLAMVNLKKMDVIQLGNDSIEHVLLTPQQVGAYAIGISNEDYGPLVTFEYPAFYDVYLINLKNGVRTLIQQKLQGFPQLSPQGDYVYWFDMLQSDWMIYSTSKRNILNLTQNMNVNFFDEENDVPNNPYSYGAAGFTEGDKHFLVYDKYDIWKIDPQAKQQPVNVTNGFGRNNNITFRYVNLTPDTPYISLDKTVILSGFNNIAKSEGYYVSKFNKETVPQKLISGDYSYSSLEKAKFTNDVIYQRSTFREYPDLWLSDLSFTPPKKISNANPQQSEYLWGTSELIKWRNTDGDTLEGLLFKPENFDPSKKYPMIVYYYERLSDNLHRHWVPAPSRSTINPSFYASRGYLVFMPDITYKVGYPGESAFNAITSGTMSLIEKGFVDAAKIGIQGQSWGGYQTAYIITRTNMFAAAEAGAPVSNMTSAYGGIRWESGMSRIFQYEKGQSRIGATLWENPYLYIENSPVFKADRINTPLMIMHNDNDGAVPWYQGIELFMALRRLNKPVWMVVYNNEAHNLMKRPNMEDLSVRMQQFFDHYLMDAPAPEWMVKGVPATEKGRNYGLELMGK